MSVQKRTRGGKVRWVARYRDPAGRERSKTFDTRREGMAWLDDRRREMRRGEWIAPEDSDVPLRVITEQWAAEATNPETITTRRSLLVSLGPLGDVPVGKLNTSMILAWRKQLLDGRPWADGTKLSESTTANTIGQLMSVLKRAKQDRLIIAVPEVPAPKSAPIRAVSRADLLTEERVQEIVQACVTPLPRSPGRPWLRVMILVAAGTGMRVSELCGLQVHDVDFLRHTIRVRRQMGRGGQLRATKSAAGVRDIPVAQWVTDVIAAWLRDHPSDIFVWVREDGRPHDRNSATNALSRTVEMHKLAPVTFHDFRHFYASRLIAAGVPVNAVQSALGHESAVVTLDTYAHLWADSSDVVRAAGAGLDLVRDQCGTGNGKGPGLHVV